MYCNHWIYDGQPTYWKGRSRERIKLGRKAAYFAVCAAEAASIEGTRDSQQRSVDLWLLASRLYGPEKNSTLESGDYGWATLRAFCYDSLALLDNSTLAAEANEQLLSLLGDLDPDEEGDATPMLKLEKKEKAVDSASSQGGEPVPDETAPKEAEVSQQLQQQAVSAPSRFQAYSNFLGSSPFLAHHSKWASENPVPLISIPLVESPLTSMLVRLRSAWPAMEYETCYKAQQKCISRMSQLQKAVPTRSRTADGSSMFGFCQKSLPLYISAPIKFSTAEEFECTRKRNSPDKEKQGAMATFYNPFENKKDSSVTAAQVLEGEERAVTISFGNRLALPLDIRQARVEFRGQDKVKTPALSFRIPPCTGDFSVNFPFTVSKKAMNDDITKESLLEVQGLSVSCLGRNFFIPIDSIHQLSSKRKSEDAPKFGTPYPYKLIPKTADETQKALNPRVEAYPGQPLLQVTFADTGGLAKYISLALSDGEVLTVPEFRLGCSEDSKLKGGIERLEIFLTGSLSTKLFDSSKGTLFGKDLTEDEFTEDLFSNDNPVPFKVRATTEISLDAINGSSDGNDNFCSFGIQIATAHNFGRQFSKDSELFLCFRYRGLANTDAEIWRKSIIHLDVSYMKGPRVSAVTLRPDISSNSFLGLLATNRDTKDDDELVHDVKMDRVGMDTFATHCDKHCMVVLTVANETRSHLTISRSEKALFGFSSSPVTETQVLPGVSAKIPILLPRLSRSPNMSEAEVVHRFVTQTSLVWEMEKTGSAGAINTRGRIRIPPPCLAYAVSRHPSFLSQICEPPCSVSLAVNNQLATEESRSIVVSMGTAIGVSCTVETSSWVPSNLAQTCSLSIEFKCVSQDGNDRVAAECFAWAGKERRTFDLCASQKSHAMKLIFCSPGSYVVSACATISRKGSGSNESWWSPMAQIVSVIEMNDQ